MELDGAPDLSPICVWVEQDWQDAGVHLEWGGDLGTAASAGIESRDRNPAVRVRMFLVGAPRFELGTSCAQGSCKNSILLVRLALFYVIGHGFGRNLAVIGPKWTHWDEADGRHVRSRRLFEGTRSRVACITLLTPQRSCVPIVENINGVRSAFDESYSFELLSGATFVTTEGRDF